MILKITAFSFLILHDFRGGFTAEHENLPTITFRNGQNWKNISTTLTNELMFYSDKGDDLFLRCNAPYPIQWKVTGLLSPPEIAHIQPPRRNLTINMFEIVMNIFFLDAEAFAGFATSAQVACEMVGNSGIKDAFLVLVRGYLNNTFIQPKTTIVKDSTLIPCPTTDPTIVPKLYFMANGTEEPVQDSIVIYHPTQGFHTSNSQAFNGNYICRQEHFSVAITALVSPSPISDDFHFSPKSSFVRVFTEETIQFECYSKSGRSVKLTSHRYNNADAIKVFIRDDTKIKNSVKGKIVCGSDDDQSIVKEWAFEFVRTPEIYFDNFRGEIHCLSPITPKRLQTLRCKNGMDCDFMLGQNCLDDVTNCGYLKQKQFYEETDAFCWLNRYKTTKACVNVPYSHLNGVAQCTVAGMVKRWEYFVTLDFLKYISWQEAPTSELIRMDEVSPILYTNKTSHFFCMAVSYLFADSLFFEIEYEGNRENMLLEGNGAFYNVSRPREEDVRKIDEFNIIGILDIKLPLDAVAVHCIAPWWNSTDDGLRTKREFMTKHLLSPTLSEEHHKGSLNQEKFYAGEKNSRLTCFAEGEPVPQYTWYFRNTPVSEMFAELTKSLGSKGESYLEFPVVSTKYDGMYTCIAENEVGKVHRTFDLKISNEQISKQNALYITIAVILFALAVVVTILWIFVRRYQKAKKLVRSLTDAEINEFFEGKPELVVKRRESSVNGYMNVDIAEFLPYKNELEIPLEDLEFDSSANNFLGSGAFSFVVRGNIISKSKPVAVKISKPSADVTLFKSLLSEVKIMSYVGKHENVVTLIGVCTQGIRDRSIHIATDICELGSLDAFLRKARPSFVDIVNGNQQIDLTLLPQMLLEEEVSTLDLISFCAQIAKGMEYLTYKSVIHGDLAARNVLITRGKIAKISDFGLSRKLYGNLNYVKKSETPLPWRWLAIESLTTLTFSMYSDVWAFGVTLFEIFTLGDVPFPNEEWNKEFLARLASGMRMGRPEYSTQEIYFKIVACWEKEPGHRPCFSTLRCFFEEMVSKYPCADCTEPITSCSPNSDSYVNIEQVDANYDDDDACDKTLEHGTISENLGRQEDAFIRLIASHPSYVALA